MNMMDGNLEIEEVKKLQNEVKELKKENASLRRQSQLINDPDLIAGILKMGIGVDGNDEDSQNVQGIRDMQDYQKDDKGNVGSKSSNDMNDHSYIESLPLVDLETIASVSEHDWLLKSPPSVSSPELENVTPEEWMRETYEKPNPDIDPVRKLLSHKLDELAYNQFEKVYGYTAWKSSETGKMRSTQSMPHIKQSLTTPTSDLAGTFTKENFQMARASDEYGGGRVAHSASSNAINTATFTRPKKSRTGVNVPGTRVLESAADLPVESPHVPGSEDHHRLSMTQFTDLAAQQQESLRQSYTEERLRSSLSGSRRRSYVISDEAAPTRFYLDDQDRSSSPSNSTGPGRGSSASSLASGGGSPYGSNHSLEQGLGPKATARKPSSRGAFRKSSGTFSKGTRPGTLTRPGGSGTVGIGRSMPNLAATVGPAQSRLAVASRPSSSAVGAASKRGSAASSMPASRIGQPGGAHARNRSVPRLSTARTPAPVSNGGVAYRRPVMDSGVPVSEGRDLNQSAAATSRSRMMKNVPPPGGADRPSIGGVAEKRKSRPQGGVESGATTGLAPRGRQSGIPAPGSKLRPPSTAVKTSSGLPASRIAQPRAASQPRMSTLSSQRQRQPPTDDAWMDECF